VSVGTIDPRGDVTGVSGHELIAHALQVGGVDHVYAVAGTPIDSTLAACADAGIRVIGARHQQGATLMSVAHNYVAGRTRSAVIVSAGPAATNCATGILVAHDNRWPLLVIAGRRPLALRGQGSFQDFAGERFFAPITKDARVLGDAQSIVTAIAASLDLTMHGAPGPVYLDIAEEALAGLAPVTLGQRVTRYTPDREASGARPDARLADAVAAIAQARRPALLIGVQARWSTPWTALRRLVEEHSVPFASAPMARGYLSDDHPLCMNRQRARMLANADVVIVVGARLDWTFRFGSEISPAARLVLIDADREEFVDVLGRGIVLSGRCQEILEELLSALDAPAVARAPRDAAWRDQLTAEIAFERPDSVSSGAATPLRPTDWLAELSTQLPDAVITVLDGSVAMTAAQQALPVRGPVQRLTPGANGCMGVGVPFAIGAALASSRPVVAICGDFALGLSAFELETAVRHRIPIVVLVANNGGINGAMRERAFMGADQRDRVMQFSPAIRHDQIMTAFGGRAWRVERRGELAHAVRGALSTGEPALIDIDTDPETPLIAAI
jgi:2-hydroxyacyl-CoA lyase 1